MKNVLNKAEFALVRLNVNFLLILSLIFFSAFSKTSFAAQTSSNRNNFSACSLLLLQPQPKFSVEKRPEVLRTNLKKSIRSLYKKIDRILAIKDEDRTFENTYIPLDSAFGDFSNETSQIVTLEVLQILKPEDEKLNVTRLELLDLMSEVLQKVNTNPKIFSALKALKTNTSEEEFALSKTIKTLEEAGQGFDPSVLKQMLNIEGDLRQLESNAHQGLANTRNPVELTASEYSKLPEAYKDIFKPTRTGNFLLEHLNGDTFQILITNVKDDNIRKKVFLTFKKSPPNNIEYFNKIFKLRQKYAQLMGKQTWSDLVINETTTAGSKEHVERFLNELDENYNKRIKPVTDKLMKLKRQDEPNATQLNPWDLFYYNNKLIAKLQDSGPQIDINKYFPFETYKKKLFNVIGHLFKVKIKRVKINQKFWADGIEAYAVFDNNTNKVRGFFYLDLYKRQYKKPELSYVTPLYENRIRANGERVTSETLMVSNLLDPKKSQNQLLPLEQALMFAHEMGHIFSGILSEARFNSAKMFSVSTDYVEVHSTLFERLLITPEILSQVTTDPNTGQSMSLEDARRWKI